MKAVEMTAIVSTDGKLTVQLPPSIPPGEHRVVLVIDDKSIPSAPKSSKPPLKLNVFSWDPWPVDSTFRREDIYGDEGR